MRAPLRLYTICTRSARKTAAEALGGPREGPGEHQSTRERKEVMKHLMQPAAPNPTRPAAGLRRRGFTLVELLVVIAMIVILAALLSPVFVQVRARARQATCTSNLEQIARAGMLYLQDNDERFPSC